MNSPSILIAEDESIVSMHLKETLEGFGYQIAGTCGSGHSAIKLAKSKKPDLVLMDIVLKGKTDGIEAASIIKADLDIPTVFLTAYSDKKTLKRAQNAHPLGYLNKPFKDKDIKTTIHMALNQSQVTKNNDYWAPWSDQILETFQTPILFLDKQGNILRCNKSFQEFVELPKNKIEGKGWEAVLSFFDENGKAYPISVRKFLKGMDEKSKYQLLIQCNGSDQKHVEIQLSSVKDKNDKVHGCLILIHDISEFTMSPEEKRRMLDLICNNLEGNLG